MNKRVLVTGAQGFIGRYLVAHFLEDENTTVIGLGRSPELQGITHHLHWGQSRLRAPLPRQLKGAYETERYRYESLDLADRPALTALLQRYRPTHIVHLAGSLRDERSEHLCKGNLEVPMNLLQAMAGASLEQTCRLVLASSGSVYGAQPDEAMPLKETDACHPLDQYAITKQAMEQMTRVSARQLGITTCWARIFCVVGPGQEERHFCGWILGQAAAIRKGLKSPEISLGPLTTTRDFIDVRDVALALAILSDRGEAGEIYNLGSGDEQPVQDVFDRMLRISELDGRITIDRKPARPADMKRNVAHMGRLNQLGFTPRVELDQSLMELLSYYLEEVASAAEQETRETETQQPVMTVAQTNITYPITVEKGLLSRLPQILARQNPDTRMVVLTDRNVQQLYGEGLLAGLRGEGVTADTIVIEAGETSKRHECYLEIIQDMHRLGFDRRALLINLGGGLVTDVGGFVAASYMRGIAFINVPTTLLAQHDSAIGGKVAVNMPWAKNFVGAFYHPKAVYCDPLVLKTLSERDVAAGVAEAIKVALCGDSELFHHLERECERARARDPQVLARIVNLAAARKINLLEADPYEVDLRRLLNLGHTFGHSLEVVMAYQNLLHGEAVGFGIAVATQIAMDRGICPREVGERIYRLLDAYDLPPAIPQHRLMEVCEHMPAIRLVRGNRLNFVMPVAIDQCVIEAEIEDIAFAKAIEGIMNHPLLGKRVIVTPN